MPVSSNTSIRGAKMYQRDASKQASNTKQKRTCKKRVCSTPMKSPNMLFSSSTTSAVNVNRRDVSDKLTEAGYDVYCGSEARVFGTYTKTYRTPFRRITSNMDTLLRYPLSQLKTIKDIQLQIRAYTALRSSEGGAASYLLVIVGTRECDRQANERRRDTGKDTMNFEKTPPAPRVYYGLLSGLTMTQEKVVKRLLSGPVVSPYNIAILVADSAAA
ncbi:hypothetical protein IW262DRAFT_1302380 [Armillaria fumosa]|nr:hypothetical protein IW262DRAFT_1302380 [Armillaria fumosa]